MKNNLAMTNCFVKNPFAQRVKVQYLKNLFSLIGSYRSTNILQTGGLVLPK
jgi:hypothetical protein